MTDINIYPPIYWLLIAANLASLYFKGEILLSWWWLIPFVAIQMGMVGLLAIIASKTMKNF